MAGLVELGVLRAAGLFFVFLPAGRLVFFAFLRAVLCFVFAAVTFLVHVVLLVPDFSVVLLVVRFAMMLGPISVRET